MDFGISIFLIAVGAILTFAVNATVTGIDIHTVGLILMVVGGLGMLWSLIVYGSGSRGTVYGRWYRPNAYTTTSAYPPVTTTYPQAVAPVAPQVVAPVAPVAPQAAAPVQRTIVRDEIR